MYRDRKHRERNGTMQKELIMTVALMTLTGCAFQEMRVEQSLNQPVNCDVADGDIRVLESE